MCARELKKNCAAGFMECHNVEDMGHLIYRLTGKNYRNFDFEIGENKAGNIAVSFIKRKKY
jgi:hypothetical protein